MSIITLLSDFGTTEGFVAAMKGVVLGIAPQAALVDATHDIEPGDVEAGAFVLGQYWRLFPAGTVHLAVVDPGVGSGRRPIALAADGRYVVGPDNGLATEVLNAAGRWRCVEIAEARFRLAAPSPTFHGRDIFAPAAAHLAAGAELEALGPEVGDPERLEIPAPRRTERDVRGRIAHIDRFGNLITDIPANWVGEGWLIAVGDRRVGGLRRTYSDVDRGALVAVAGSLGTVEIAIREASARVELGAKRGDPVRATR